MILSIDGRNAPGAGQAGLRGRQAGVHRQADRRLAGRGDRDLSAGQGAQRALLHQLVAAVRRADARHPPGPAAGRTGRLRPVCPCSLEPHHPDFFWYGIHGVEPLFTIMGPGCVSVTRVHTEGTDMAVGVWNDGRIGTFRGIREGRRGYGSTVFGTKGIVPGGGFDGYEPLIVEIVKFFKTGKPPVSEAETLEIFAFMEAADESKRQGGCPVTLESVMKKAQQEAASIK